MSNNNFKLKALFVLSAIILALMPLKDCFSLSEDFLDRFAANGIMFYNPEECAGTTVASAGLTGNSVKEKMWNFFRAKGLNEAQTAGVLGNAFQESSLNPARRNSDGRKFWGLFQFKFAYADDMYQQLKTAGLYDKYVEDYATYGGIGDESKIPVADLDKLMEIQLNYAWDGWRKWDNWQTKIQGNVGDEHEVEWAAEVFLVHFEGASPGDSTLMYYNHGDTWQGPKGRRESARQIYEEFKGSTVVNGASFSSNYKAAGQCCDPNGSLATDGIYFGTKYNLTDGQVAGLTAIAVAENGTSEAGVKSEASLIANLFEFKKKDKIGNADELVNYVRTSGWFSTAKQYNESYSSSYTEAVKDVLVNGNRTLPPQIVEHDCFTSACGAGIGSATNNGKEIDLNDKSQFKRGITVLHQSGGGLNGSYVFWDWADPEKKSGDPFGYFDWNAPDEGVLNGTTGTSSAGIAGSNTVWEDGWITNGLDGRIVDKATTTSVPSLDASFGGDFTTKLPKDTEKNGPAKITVLVTNTSDGGGSNATSLYNGNPYPPHFTVNLKTNRAYQHGSVLKKASAMGASGDNNGAGVEVSLMGYITNPTVPGWDLSSDTDFSDEGWTYLGELLTAISVETGISLEDGLTFSGLDNTIAGKVKAGIAAFNASQNIVCSGTSGDAKALQDAILKYAWPEYSTEKRGIDSRKPEYATLINNGVHYAGGCSGNDCGGFVTTMMRESGWDDEYNPAACGTYCNGNGQAHYLETSEKWEDVTSTIKSNADAKPGDVLISHGHTLLFVGDIPGFDGMMASASFATKCPNGASSCCDDCRIPDCPRTRPPMADKQSDIYTGYIAGGDYRVFRKTR